MVTLNLPNHFSPNANREVFFELSGTQRGVAHLAHLGGFLGGYLYIKMLYKNEVWDIFSFLKSKVPGFDKIVSEEMSRLKRATSGIFA